MCDRNDINFCNRFETSAKENQCVLEAAKYLIDAIIKLETPKNEYDFDYDSTITLHEQSMNKTNTKCCT